MRALRRHPESVWQCFRGSFRRHRDRSANLISLNIWITSAELINARTSCQRVFGTQLCDGEATHILSLYGNLSVGPTKRTLKIHSTLPSGGSQLAGHRCHSRRDLAHAQSSAATARRDKATPVGRDTEQFCRDSTRKDAQQDWRPRGATGSDADIPRAR